MTVDTNSLVATNTDLELIMAPYEDTEDGAEHHTHIVNPPDNMHIWKPGMSSKDVVFLARMNGWTVKALCGYEFIPKRNPEKFSACEECVTIAGELMRRKGE